LNKRKIINDPVYGFISIGSELIFDLIEHPYFQRLRYIRQLGLTDLVYPGALHTRFHHALGAMHLMGNVLDNLRNKGVAINAEEFEAAQAAILLHDIGHGPFSHALEETLLSGIKHESISYLFMKELNVYLDGRLDLALKIFRNSYSRKFFHQLVSSQLDIDRLDYLKRDCFFTGVMEGSIGVDRIIAMLDVHEDKIVVQEKGIYSIENFLNARRLMYWQVYLHKTAVSAERMLVNIIKRAQYLVSSGEQLFMSDALRIFLSRNYTIDDFSVNPSLLNAFGQLDDNDIWGAIKIWKNHSDTILAQLCTMLLQRNLFKITLTSDPIKKEQVEDVKESIKNHFHVGGNDASYFFSVGTVSNAGYMIEGESINIMTKKGKIIDIAEASDLSNIVALSKIVKKNYLCWPKGISL
jgi:hypothetical protein